MPTTRTTPALKRSKRREGRVALSASRPTPTGRFSSSPRPDHDGSRKGAMSSAILWSIRLPEGRAHTV